ncbi:glycoside hydrolase family 3 N-terminal domain-containing protein [Priestia megaterium]|uniref:glycoside hydrolase family 3 N-terminal domain-containing protein n=1 Tax=Priestia megaterium TaxID=1404 RepID=UPI002877257F|nr:glycoside hydrolase family 3 N-terminal domain-containing protein [Priestia megaterium]MBX4160196.1 glycosyl hydrolase family 3 [Priestia megaterium]
MKMKKPIFLVIYAAIAVVLITGAAWAYQSMSKPASSVVKAPTTEKISTKPIKASAEKSKSQPKSTYQQVQELMSNMTLQEKIGQMMVVGFQTEEVDDHIKAMISTYHAGGVILFDRNMKTPKQVATLTNNLQDLAQETKNQIPLMMGVDQEGGDIVRMKDQVSPIPSQQELGQKNDKDLVYQAANRNGQELAAMGFNVDFAPVLDLSDTDTRSFGTDPEKAAEFGKAAVSGLNANNLTAALKHFPGNGRSNIDPHLETSSVKADKLDLENGDIYPFKQMITNVDNNNFFVMVTHIKYPAYDKENPASISPIIIQELLRKQLGYKGLVVTDDLEMGAVSKYFTYEELGVRAVEAGADVLLVCHTLDSQEKMYNGILQAVKEGKISEKRIDESVKRILTHKLTSDIQLHVDLETAKNTVGKNK